jgi:predicted RNase H-like HicB family nuclease
MCDFSAGSLTQSDGGRKIDSILRFTSDITYSTMNRKKLNRIWQDIEAARRTLPKLADLEALAKRCGRKASGGGKHMMWTSTAFPQHRPFPIPRHGGNPEATYTVRDSVLDMLEADAAAETVMDPTKILKKPYARQVIPQEDGLYKAEILEFPGCFAVGDSAIEALASLEEIAIDWLAATIAQGQNIPEPSDATGYSGKTVLRMSKTLHKKAAQFAMRDGVSLNQFVVNCVAEQVGLRAKPVLLGAQSTALSAVSIQLEATVPHALIGPGVIDATGATATTSADAIRVKALISRAITNA